MFVFHLKFFGECPIGGSVVFLLRLLQTFQIIDKFLTKSKHTHSDMKRTTRDHLRHYPTRYVQDWMLMRFKFLMIASQSVLIGNKSPKDNQFCQIWSNMKMSNNPAKYEVLIKQYFHSILDISVSHRNSSWRLWYFGLLHMQCCIGSQKVVFNWQTSWVSLTHSEQRGLKTQAACRPWNLLLIAKQQHRYLSSITDYPARPAIQDGCQ